MFGTVCQGCGLDFHETRRLSSHWKERAQGCFREVASFFEPMSASEAESVAVGEAVVCQRKRAAGHRHERALIPGFRAIGPTFQGRVSGGFGECPILLNLVPIAAAR